MDFSVSITKKAAEGTVNNPEGGTEETTKDTSGATNDSADDVDQARDDGTADDTGNTGEQVGNEGNNLVDKRAYGTTEGEDIKDGADDVEDVVDKGVDGVEETLKLGLRDTQVSGGESLGHNAGDLVQKVLKIAGGLGGTLILGDGTGVDLVQGGVL